MSHAMLKLAPTPWLNDAFLRALEGAALHTRKYDTGTLVLAGVEQQTRFGLRVLQIGSHFGVGLYGTTAELSRNLRLAFGHDIDAVSIISPLELAGLEPYRTANSTGTIVSDLSVSKEVLWRNIRKSFKGCINQVAKKGNSIAWDRPQDLAEMESIYREHIAAKEYDGIDWSVVAALHGLNEPGFRLDLALVRNPHGAAAAMAAFLVCGDTVTYFVGGSSREQLMFYPGHYLHWQAMLRYKEMGCARYDFGGATEDKAKRTYEITKFKQGFGGSYLMYYTYEIPLSFRYGLYQSALRLAKGLRLGGRR